MSKVTKRELLKRIEALEEWASGADEMLTELNHALPDPEYDAKCKAVADVEASLDEHRERLGLNKPKVGDVYVVVDSKPDANDVKVGCKHTVVAMNGEGDVIFNSSYIAHQTKDGKLEIYGLGVVLEKFVEPKLKQLDQSVFDGLDEKWRFAAVDADGKAHRCNLHVKPHHEKGEFWRGCTFPPLEFELIGEGYDATNWQDSLIERKPELTGSDLCRKMLERGDKAVLCLVIDNKETGVKRYDAITNTSGRSAFLSHYTYWDNAIPVNNQGEPLTQAEVGL